MAGAWQVALHVAAALTWAALAEDNYEAWFPGKRGCWRRYDGYLPEMAGHNTEEVDADHCALRCNVTSGCKFFNYELNSSTCRLAPFYAETVDMDNVYLISGLGECAAASPCSDSPADGFPGRTAEQSNMAWMGNRQPVSMECWPKGSTGQLLTCSETSVIEDTASSVWPWPGGCTDLAPQTYMDSTCEAECRANPACSVWEIGSDGSCHHGLGKSCYNSGTTLVQGQRLQHGNVRVLLDLTGVQILTGMSQVFDLSLVGAAGPFTTAQEAIEGCKRVCYSDIYCEYWSYSSTYGCWMEDKRVGSVPNPLTLDVAVRNTAEAGNCVGEYIQHYCTTNNTEVSDEDELWCLLHGTRWLPDMAGQTVTVEPDVALCQQRCADTALCERFSFYPESGKCYLQDESAVETQDYEATSGLKACPPSSSAACAAHPICSSTEGYCCPDAYGTMDSCCGQSVGGQAISVVQTTTAADVVVGSTGETDTGLDWWAIALISLAICACVLVGVLVGMFLRKGGAGGGERQARMYDMEQREVEVPLQREESVPSPAPYDTSRLPFPEAGVAHGGRDHVPFPEAGLRNPNALPFPEAGLPRDFQQLHPGVAPVGGPPVGSYQGYR